VNKREFITLLGGATAWPLAARAQQDQRVRLVGLLWGTAANDPEWRRRFSAFAAGLRESGWIEGKNLAFAPKYAVGNPDQFSALAADLVQMRSDVIVTTSAGLTAIAREVTKTIPIVAASAGELEGTGLIASIQKPDGNVTGIQILSPELMSKRIDLLKRLVPDLTQLGIIVPVAPAAINSPSYMERIIDAARALKIQVRQFEVPSEFAPAIAALAQECQGAILQIRWPPKMLNSSRTLRHNIVFQQCTNSAFTHWPVGSCLTGAITSRSIAKQPVMWTRFCGASVQASSRNNNRPNSN
jgi:ABC transporter substrate binding protein